MIPAIWPISLALEAALAVLVTRRGGFPAFRRFLWFDVVSQCVEMATPAAWYWLAHRSAEVAGIALLGFVVAEARTCKDRLQVARLLILAAIIAIPLHLALASNVPWSQWASGIWQAVALSHSLMALLLFAGMATARWTAHGLLLASWLLADAALFYVAPHFRVGMAVLWLNATAWAVWLGVTLRP